MTKKNRNVSSDFPRGKNSTQNRLESSDLGQGLFGLDLAQSVYRRLARSKLALAHRDYCGTGFERKGEKVIYSEVYDGELSNPPLKAFSTEKEFVQWLSIQSDRSMARVDGSSFKDGNQTITLLRLREFVGR